MKKIISDTYFFITSPRCFVRERIKLPLAKFIYDTIDLYKARTKTGINNVRDLLFRGTVVALITALVVWLSIFMYVAFYYVYVPAIAHEKPVHFKFRSCERWNEHKCVCSFPSGSVQLNQKQQTLMVGQPYKIYIDLEMPESPINKDLGMFMVCADFHGKDGKLITNSCRSAMLHYRSPAMELLYKIMFSPFYLMGSMEEKQVVQVELFSSYLEPDNQQVTNIFIEIQTQHIEIYSAKFSINANFSGLRYVMFHWPILSAAIGITSNLFFIAVVSLLSWYQIIHSEEYMRYLNQQANKEKAGKAKFVIEEDTSSSEDVSVVGDDDEETVRRRKGSVSEC